MQVTERVEGRVPDLTAHLAKSPGDLAILVALTLLGAMRGAPVGRAFLALLPLAWLAGGEIGLRFPSTADLDWVSALCFLLVGALVAADRNLSLSEAGPLCAVIGAFQGYLTGSALSITPSGQLALAGSVTALLIVATLVAGFVVSLKAYWARIAVRVLGSWIAATGLLVLGWTCAARGEGRATAKPRTRIGRRRINSLTRTSESLCADCSKGTGGLCRTAAAATPACWPSGVGP